MSTGISTGELPCKLKELGGRATDDHAFLAAVPPPPTLGNTEQLSRRPHGLGTTVPRSVSTPTIPPDNRPLRQHGGGPSVSPRSDSYSDSSSVRSSSSSPGHKLRLNRKHKRRRRSSSGPDDSHRSLRKLLPNGMTYSRPQLSRKTVRHTGQEGPTQSKDQYEAIVDSAGAMTDRDGRKSGEPSNVDQFTVCALRGFGTHKVSLATGTYGVEMENCIRRQARSELDRLWREKLKIPIANRVAKASPSCRFGDVESERTDEITIALSDCTPLDSARCRARRWAVRRSRLPVKNRKL